MDIIHVIVVVVSSNGRITAEIVDGPKKIEILGGWEEKKGMLHHHLSHTV